MASKLNLNIEQGASFSLGLELTDDNGVTFDLGGYTGRSQMRKSHSSLNFVELDVEGSNVLATPSTKTFTSDVSKKTKSVGKVVRESP